MWTIPVVFCKVRRVRLDHVAGRVVRPLNNWVHPVVCPAIISSFPHAIFSRDTRVCDKLSVQQTFLVHIDDWNLVSNHPEYHHEHDRYDELKRGAEIGSPPENKVFAHESAEVTNTLWHADFDCVFSMAFM